MVKSRLIVGQSILCTNCISKLVRATLDGTELARNCELLSHIAGETTLGGLTGWRLFLGIVGVIALFWGFVTLLTTVDPRFECNEFEAVVRTNQRSYWSLLKSFFTKPAMAGIIAQVAS